MTTLYQSILHTLPHTHIRVAFANGSGVFKQLENEPDMAKTMIDFVFVVDDSIK